jgi:RNA-directed DNA polymerase
MQKLLLQLHPHKIEIRKTSQGIDFLGYVILPHRIIIRPKTRQRIVRKVLERESLYRQGNISKEKYLATIESYLGIVSHSRNYKLKKFLST